jgi:hypothetical protein
MACGQLVVPIDNGVRTPPLLMLAGAVPSGVARLQDRRRAVRQRGPVAGRSDSQSKSNAPNRSESRGKLVVFQDFLN